MKHRESVYQKSRVPGPVLRVCSVGGKAFVCRAVVCFNCLLRRLTPPPSRALTLLLTQAASPVVAAFSRLHAYRLGRWKPLQAFFLMRAVFTCGGPGPLHACPPAIKLITTYKPNRCDNRIDNGHIVRKDILK